MNKFMDIAISEAEKAYRKGEIPVGAVIVCGDKVISKAHNCRERKQCATKHAEIVAIEKACKKLKSWRLENCEIYVSLEPCPMCAGAIANARIKKIHYAAEEKTSGDGLMNKIFSSERLNHKVEISLEQDEKASKLLTTFFKNRRKKTD